MSRWSVAAPSLLLALAGCLGGGSDGGAAADLSALDGAAWPDMDVQTTAVEAEEFRGRLRVGWRGGLFAIDSESEPDLARRTVVDGDQAYRSRFGMGWTRLGVAQGIERHELSNRLVLWDLPALVRMPGLEHTVTVEGGRTTIDAAGTVEAGGGLQVDLQVVVEGGRVVSAYLASPSGRESPFSFAPSGEPLAFEPAVPRNVLPADEVRSLDAAAQDGHAVLLRLVRDYARTRQGMLPDRLDPQTLALEMLAADADWPVNPYDGEPLRDDEASGHFRWERCGTNDGAYAGHGFDGPVRLEQFGSAGCPAAPVAAI